MPILTALIAGVVEAIASSGAAILAIPLVILGYETFVALIGHTFGEDRKRKY